MVPGAAWRAANARQYCLRRNPKTSTGKGRLRAARAGEALIEATAYMMRSTPGRNIAAPRSSGRSPQRRRSFLGPVKRRERVHEVRKTLKKRAQLRGSFSIALASRLG